jgi:hypothetical protein
LAQVVAAGCSHDRAARSEARAAPVSGDKDRDKGEILVGPGAMEGGAGVLAAWLAYGAGKLGRYLEQPPPPANESADDFPYEIAGREAQCKMWVEQAGTEKRRNAELDRQVEIWRAGFLPELVVAVHAQPGWTIPSKTVSSLRFEALAKRFPGNYQPGAPVAVKPRSGKLVPDSPGEDFPDPQQLPIGPESCGRAAGERDAAWRRWRALEAKLGGAPVAASSTQDFVRQLLAVQRHGEPVPRGVTWVSRRVAHLALLEGFCAIEDKDWPRAVSTLTLASSLDRANPTPRLELSLALTYARRLDDALKEVDRALAFTEDACAVALGWRRRGYILIELGALEAARFAYEKSLSIEPGNSIAERELEVIAGEIKGHGGMHQRKGSYTPPPSLGVVLTKCRRGGQPAAGAAPAR